MKTSAPTLKLYRPPTTANASSEEEARAEQECLQQCDDVRMEIASALYAGTGATSLMTERDIKDYMDALSHEKMKSGGFMKAEKELEALKDMIRYAKQFAREALDFGAEFHAALRQAKEDNVLSPDSIREWERLARERNFNWTQVKAFFTKDGENGFKKWAKNWKDLGGMLKEIDKYRKTLGVDETQIEELATLKKFKTTGSFKERMKAAQDALDALVEFKHGGSELYQDAEKQLYAAVRNKCISERIAKNWLTYTFKQKKPSALKRFVQKQLPSLIKDWEDLHDRYLSLREDGKKLPPPEAFAAMQWHDRKQLVEKAESINLANVPPLFLQIRRAMEAKDWTEAAEFLDEAEAQEWDAAQQRELILLRKSWRKQSDNPQHAASSAREKPDAMAVLTRMREAMGQIKFDSVKRRLRAGMNWGARTFWVLCTIYYNWEWCRQHRYSSDEIDAQQREHAKYDTETHLKFGQPRDHTVNDLTSTTSQEPAIRTERDTRSAQGIFVDDSTDNKMLARVAHENEHNWSFWYWTRLVEKDIPFSEMQYLIYNVFPILKQGMRQLDAMGIQYTDKGPPVPKNGSVAAAA